MQGMVRLGGAGNPTSMEREGRWGLIVIALLSALALWLALRPVPAHAVDFLPEAVRELDLVVDKGRLMRLPGPATAVFLAQPGIADVQVKSPTMLYVYGAKAGETTLYAVGAGDQVVAAVGIRVTHNLKQIASALENAGLDEGISLRSSGDQLIVSGDVSSPAKAQQIMALVAGQMGQDDPVNRLKISGSNQVNLRVRVAEVSRDTLKQFGFNWEALLSSGDFLLGLATGRPIFNAAGNFLVRPTSGTSNQNSIFGSWGRGNLDLNFMIDALEDEGLVSVLAEPNLTARSGEKAEFLAGGEFPILVPQSDDTVTVEYKEFGVKLEFTPTILDSGRIAIDVAPEVSQLVDSDAVTLNNFVVPLFSKRSAETLVELGSGQSFAIAGLIQSSTDHNINKLPGLGDIPILGTLFRSDTFQKGETELVIIITPYLVRPTDEPGKLSTPIDGFAPPTDLDRILFGRNYAGRITEVEGRTRGVAGVVPASVQRLEGPAGFVLE
jgi:pilus assembly protein CpaC